MAIYLYPDVGRAGLGNRIFPWARAEIAAQQTGWPLIAPIWVRPKIGPILRGESDFRFYAGLFRATPYIHGLRRWVVLATALYSGERQLGAVRAEGGVRPRVITFKGWGRYFEGMAPFRSRLIAAFHRMVHPAIMRKADVMAPQSPTIMVHIRRGDFGEPVPFGTLRESNYYALSDAWYLAAIEHTRQRFGNMPVWIFSDGSHSDMAPLLQVANCSWIRGGNALVDLLLLSKAAVLVASPGSTFSAWAAFLGSATVVTVSDTLYVPFCSIGESLCPTDGYGRFMETPAVHGRCVSAEVVSNRPVRDIRDPAQGVAADLTLSNCGTPASIL